MHTKEPRLPAKLTLDGDTPCSTPVHNHGEQQAEITLYKAKVSLKKKAATSDHRTKFLVASTVVGLDFECKAKLNCTPNTMGKTTRLARKKSNHHPYFPETPGHPAFLPVA